MNPFSTNQKNIFCFITLTSPFSSVCQLHINKHIHKYKLTHERKYTKNKDECKQKFLKINLFKKYNQK